MHHFENEKKKKKKKKKLFFFPVLEDKQRPFFFSPTGRTNFCEELKEEEQHTMGLLSAVIKVFSVYQIQRLISNWRIPQVEKDQCSMQENKNTLYISIFAMLIVDLAFSFLLYGQWSFLFGGFELAKSALVFAGSTHALYTILPYVQSTALSCHILPLATLILMFLFELIL